MIRTQNHQNLKIVLLQFSCREVEKVIIQQKRQGKLTASNKETTQLLNTVLSYPVLEYHKRYFPNTSELIIKNIVVRNAFSSHSKN